MRRSIHSVLLALSLVLIVSQVAWCQTQEKQDAGGSQPEATEKKGSKVTRKLRQALPDCIGIFALSTCRENRDKEQAEQERQEEQLARATKRCQELEKARPAPNKQEQSAEQPSRPELASNESSSRPANTQQIEVAPYCTPQDLLAAEHDVEVGDFNLENKNYRGAEMRYRSALERLPGEPIATLHLARLLEKQGKATEAHDQYQSYMTWSPTGKDAEEAQAAIKRLEGQVQK